MTASPYSGDPADLFEGLDYPAVTPQRIYQQLKADSFSPEYSPQDDHAVLAQHNDLDWVFSLEEDLVKVECVLPTTLSASLVADALRSITNEVNAQAFDGRALVGVVDNHLELRGDACFVISAGMSDQQLFHSLNFAMVAAQDAMLNTLDTFNSLTLELGSSPS